MEGHDRQRYKAWHRLMMMMMLLGNLLHQFIRSKVSQETGLRLEWGIVTGIKCAKRQQHA